LGVERKGFPFGFAQIDFAYGHALMNNFTAILTGTCSLL